MLEMVRQTTSYYYDRMILWSYESRSPVRFEGLLWRRKLLVKHDLIPRRSGQVEDQLYDEDFVYASPVGFARIAFLYYCVSTS